MKSGYQQIRTCLIGLLLGLNDHYMQSAWTSAWDKESVQKLLAITTTYYCLLLNVIAISITS